MKNRSIVKAESFAQLLRTAPIEIAPGRIFQQGLQAQHILAKQRHQWWVEETESFLDIEESMKQARQVGAYDVNPDFGHVSSNMKTLTRLGFRGVAQQVKPGTLLREGADICFGAMADYCLRLADQEGVSQENAAVLRQLAVGAPRTMYEAMQMISLYFYLHEFIGGARVRTLGRLDEVLYPFYCADRERGMTREQAKALWKEFLIEFWLMKVPFDMPFCIGGLGEDGEETTNELSYLIVEAYDECNVHSPKIHVRVSEKTPEDFIKRVLACIRGGNSSFVFINDAVGIPLMQQCGATIEEARSFVPIGCYEPAVYDKELPCTGNGWISPTKALEFVFTDGCDYLSGSQVGLRTGEINSYEEFYAALKAQIAYMIEQSLNYIREAERHYAVVGPDPILSALLSPCAESGIDAYEGGAKYNNSSLSVGSLASAADAIYATKYLVFDQKQLTFTQLRDILLSNWEGHEQLRSQMLRLPEKYGNNIEEVDAIAADLSAYCASLINGQPNARGGIFKASNFTIDWCFSYGKKTMATPDGRKHGEPLSKNNSAVTGMDRKGLTALIQSAVKLNPSLFPNGSVLDFVLHPSAVAGEDGLDAFLALLKVYFAKGGFAMHGNVFRAEDLKAAQADPEKYANLQVRVCGWNVFFVNLSKEEQDAFIRQAEGCA